MKSHAELPNIHDHQPRLDPELPPRAVALAEELLKSARAQQSDAEHDQGQKIARMMDDAAGKRLTIALSDQAFRSHRPQRVADQLSYLLERYGTPGYMEWWERTALTLGGVLAHYLPSMVVPPLIARLRQETRSVILPGEENELRRYLQKRRQTGTRLNLNQLGEAILGEEEAGRRLRAYLDLLAREDVEYISVKVSSVLSQINLVAFAQTVELVKERLRILYRQALQHQYRYPDGRTSPKFINLDMEEYRDLHLTMAAFCGVLDEPAFMSLRAGIVLQAYLPDSYAAQCALTEWALGRVARGGAPIKIRIVKGANLAMEQVDAALHGFAQAPYTTKQEVDANFKRMVEYGCRPQHASAVHIGIASHNLFDVALGLLLREARGLQNEVEFEMLEGMANHQARAVQAKAGGLLLYAPVVKSEDFHSAIAYLVRRLDENTAPENFLHDLFDLQPGSPAWNRQRDRFLAACDHIKSVSDQPRRQQDRRTEEPLLHLHEPFANVPDTDWSLPANTEWAQSILARWHQREVEKIPLQINGAFVDGATLATGHDPSRPGTTAYQYAQADAAQVDQALAAATEAALSWGRQPVAARRELLLHAAAELARSRSDLIGAMMLDGAKTVAEADVEVSEAIDFARYYAHGFEQSQNDLLADCEMKPLGVVVVTPPWNFPLAIPAGGVLAALMAGNSVILKPAPEATLVGWYLAQALWKAGIPQPVLQFLPCPDNDIGRTLVTDARVGGVILTGSMETARLFHTWRPDLPLFAETSGKNSLIITSLADQDQAIKDLVRSAFGHNGQKCSAASLAILEAEVYDSPLFRRQLRDAAASLHVGSAWNLASLMTPLTQPPSDKLLRALTTLEPGEEWLLEPAQNAQNPQLWSPGIKLGVKPNSFFHQTECFGPVLGLMRAENLAQAVAYANDVAYGLTGGIHSLDDREIAYWRAHVQVGNAYINRHITGAIVQRQPFGGWKDSVVGPGAKAGGPNYLLQFVRWTQKEMPKVLAEISPQMEGLLARLLGTMAAAPLRERLHAAAASYAWAWQHIFSQEHDPSQVLGEANRLGYHPAEGIVVRVTPQDQAEQDHTHDVALALLAILTTGQAITLSLAPGAERWRGLAGEPGVQIVVEDEAGLMARLQAAQTCDRLRVFAPVSEPLRSLTNTLGMTIIDAPVLLNGRLELRHYLREQAVSQTMHRYGNLLSESARN